MNFKCCEYLLNEIVFAQSEVIPCCCSPNHNYELRFISNFDGKEFDIEEYISKRNEYIDRFKKGDIPASCVGCPKIQEKDWDETFKIKRIIITNRTKCSCDCVYCSLVTTSTQTKLELNTRVPYDILPALKDIYNKNLIDENTLITIAGGECSEYPAGELEYMIYVASLLNCHLEILSSGMFYSKAIEQALKTEKALLKISVDSGFKKTFEKIKRVKSYKSVWKNIKNYVIAGKENPKSQVVLKYILLPGINDNKIEAESFIQKCKDVQCDKIELSSEYIWSEKNRGKAFPQTMVDAIKFIKNSGFVLSYEGPLEKELRELE